MRDLIQEARTLLVPIKGKVAPFKRILWRALVEEMSEGKIKISLRPQKRMGKKIGDIQYHDLQQGKAEIRFLDTGSILLPLGYIAHEMTHVKQYVRGHLRVEYDKESQDAMFIWHNKPYMRARDYAKITDYYEYAKLPWEAEAIHVQNTLPKQWLSGAIPSLRGKDKMLDYLIDNDLLLY